MARITLNDQAPEGAGKFSFAHVDVEVGSGGLETADAETISGALQHPWLDVDLDDAGVVESVASFDYTDDDDKDYS